MRAAAELRRQIESALAAHIPAALSSRPPVQAELLSCGLAEVDAVLGVGLPLGAITELTGAQSSGRTTLALSILAKVTQRGESCAYVDVSDALNPISAAALGVDLRCLLWVRIGEADVNDAGSPFVSAMPVSTSVSEKPVYGAEWCHPRDEAVGLHCVVSELFHAAHTERVDFTPRCSEAMRRERVRPMVFDPQSIAHSRPVQCHRSIKSKETSWTRLDHALRATDMLLSAGGFPVLVLDMGDVAPEQARRVPLATWYRFRLLAEKSRTLFLLITRATCANSCAAVSLQCQQEAADWQQAAIHSPKLLTGLRYRISVKRSRVIDPMRKKPAAAEVLWSSTTTWSR